MNYIIHYMTTKFQTKKISVPKILMCGHVQYYPATSLYQVKTSGGPVGLYPLNNNTGYVINYPKLPSEARILFYVVLICTQICHQYARSVT
jgi:hypothetical protein